MLKLIEKSLAKLGASGADCSNPDLTVPDICAECRQLSRWGQRVIDWSGKSDSRLAAVMGAILKSHDDILSSICGNVLLQDEDSCEKFLATMDLLAVSTRIPFLVGADDCARVGRVATYDDCDGNPVEWFEGCAYLCETCIFRTLDPCNNADDLAIAETVVKASQFRNRSTNTAADVIEALTILFAGSTPRIIHAGEARVVIYLGREMTPQEIQLRQFYISLLPIKQGVEIALAEPLQ